MRGLAVGTLALEATLAAQGWGADLRAHIVGDLVWETKRSHRLLLSVMGARRPVCGPGDPCHSD